MMKIDNSLEWIGFLKLTINFIVLMKLTELYLIMKNNNTLNYIT